MKTTNYNIAKVFLYTLLILFPLCNAYADAKALQAKKQNKKKTKSIVEPLFGKKLQNVEIKSDKLKGACFYLVSGHGGPDPGAVNTYNGHEIHEDEYAYDVTLRLARNLMEQGAEVRIIIQDKNDGIRNDTYLKNSKTETCMGEKIPQKQGQRLRQRTKKINTLYNKEKNKYKYSRAIIIHVDSRNTNKKIDVHFYYAKNSKKGKRTADIILNKFRNKYQQHNPKRGYEGTVSIHPKELTLLYETNPAAIYVELANIKNKDDLKRLLIENNRQAMANWMCEALIEDYKKNKN